jgi:hypothetical protein
MAIMFRLARLERAHAVSLAPPTLSPYQADIAWTERFVAWSPKNAEFVAEARSFFGNGYGGVSDVSPFRSSTLFSGLLSRARTPDVYGLLMAEDMAHRDEIAKARRMYHRLVILIAEYAEATGDRHPEYHNPRQSLPRLAALVARPIEVEAHTQSEQSKPVYEFLDRMMPGKGIMQDWRH